MFYRFVIPCIAKNYMVKMFHFVQHDSEEIFQHDGQHDSEKTIDNYIIINNATVKKIFLS